MKVWSALGTGWECLRVCLVNRLLILLPTNGSFPLKLSEELLAKWLSLPEAQHVPLCQHMLGFAMKSVTQTAMGSSFEDDREVIRFRRHHDAVSVMKSQKISYYIFPHQQRTACACVQFSTGYCWDFNIKLTSLRAWGLCLNCPRLKLSERSYCWSCCH